MRSTSITSRKKKAIIGVLFSLLLMVLIITVFPKLKSTQNTQLLSETEGTLYYLERVDGVKTLFKADTNLENKTVVYSHKGKGKDSTGDYNDNILDFYYNQVEKTFHFIAMNNGAWSMFSLKEGETQPTLLKEDVMEMSTDYIKTHFKQQTVVAKKGSLYLTENNEESLLLKFKGIYDPKWTGYNPIGFSPNGNYLVYTSMEHLTPIGTIIDGFLTDSFGHTYIMDLSTKKSTRFVDSYEIQWVVE
ncbi:hypothetical protein M3182_02655 [Mesobacillus maritimus]|uniref:hypothetical protein n=1 Tax=Mesobacillus maritimus TaxID=1643336 RepID=UPI00203BF57C|nr:hypothetical protein [Mesobacillus maritimus]MCM3584643.1 hypothetical protein [Mesobacillus maritimus]MCM3671379.1 hypothetical protein [Mesobacillus maritimus]